MNSREQILNKIKSNSREQSGSPESYAFNQGKGTIIEFEKTLKTAGGEMILSSEFSALWLKTNFGNDAKVYSEVDSVPGNYALKEDQFTHENLQKIQVAVLKGNFGVAENGAVWVTEPAHRSIPFITQHLILTVSEDQLVSTMHDAYEMIGKQDFPSFGTFISGPSKTADIEQSLVYGAHGAISLTVIINSGDR